VNISCSYLAIRPAFDFHYLQIYHNSLLKKTWMGKYKERKDEGEDISSYRMILRTLEDTDN